MSACYDHGTSEILFRTTTFCPVSTVFIETEYKDEVCDALNAFMSACYNHGTSEKFFRTTTFCPVSTEFIETEYKDEVCDA